MPAIEGAWNASESVSTAASSASVTVPSMPCCERASTFDPSDVIRANSSSAVVSGPLSASSDTQSFVRAPSLSTLPRKLPDSSSG